MPWGKLATIGLKENSSKPTSGEITTGNSLRSREIAGKIKLVHIETVFNNWKEIGISYSLSRTSTDILDRIRLASGIQTHGHRVQWYGELELDSPKIFINFYKPDATTDNLRFVIQYYPWKGK